jgi:hypothetical protein
MDDFPFLIRVINAPEFILTSPPLPSWPNIKVYYTTVIQKNQRWQLAEN